MTAQVAPAFAGPLDPRPVRPAFDPGEHPDPDGHRDADGHTSPVRRGAARASAAARSLASSPVAWPTRA